MFPSFARHVLVLVLCLTLVPAVAEAAPQDIDLLTDDTLVTSIEGPASESQTGRSVADAGDFNGDGFDDVIVGAPEHTPGDRLRAGAVYVVFGGTGNDPSDVDLEPGSAEERFTRIDGEMRLDNAGTSVRGAGDVNGDGVDDVIVGAPGGDPLGRFNAGAAYVVYGTQTPDPPNVDLATDEARFQRIVGAATEDQLGVSVAGAGDVNGDGGEDVVIGASFTDFAGSKAGSLYVVQGSVESVPDPADVDAASDASRFQRVDGAAANDQLGVAVDGAGDFDGDGVGDVVAGALSADVNGRNAGAAYVVHGQTGSDPADIALASDPARFMRVQGVRTDDQLGNAVAGAGDQTGDGRDDVIVGAQLNDNGAANTGAAYVIAGPTATTADPADVNLASTDAAQTARYRTLSGANAEDRVGFSVGAAGDPNGDARDDVIVGALQLDPQGRVDPGAAFVVYGADEADPADLVLRDADEDPRPYARIDGAAQGDQVGRSVSGAGDFNGDTRDDVIVGALRTDDGDLTNSGSASVVGFDGDDDGVADGLDNCDGTSSFDQEDIDRDGEGNPCDGDDDGDGTLDADDDFPRDKSERVDTDADGTGDNADTDDDGDGTPDAQDRFPLDRAEQGDCDGDGVGDNADTTNGCKATTTTTTTTTTTPKPDPAPAASPAPPASIAPALLVKQAAPTLAARPGGLRLTSGLAVVCPAGGPVCRARVSFGTLRRSPTTRRIVKVFVTRKGRTIVVQPGVTRPIRRLLTPAAARLLRRRGTLTLRVRATLLAGPVRTIRDETLRISAG